MRKSAAGSRLISGRPRVDPGIGYSWDGATAYQRLDQLAEAIAASQQWTISYWMRHPGPTATGQNLWNINTAAGGNITTSTFLGSTNYIAIFAGSSWVTSGRVRTTNVLDGAWHHIMVSANHAANRLDWYVDGVLEQGSGGSTWPAVSATDLVTWGAEWDSGPLSVGNFWGGDSLWLAVWASQLDLSVAAPRLYNAGRPVTPDLADDPPDWWFVHGGADFREFNRSLATPQLAEPVNVVESDLIATGLA